MVGVARESEKDKGLAAASVVADRLYNLAGMAVLLPVALLTIGSQLSIFQTSSITSLSISSVGIMHWINKILIKSKKYLGIGKGLVYITDMYFLFPGPFHYFRWIQFCGILVDIRRLRNQYQLLAGDVCIHPVLFCCFNTCRDQWTGCTRR